MRRRLHGLSCCRRRSREWWWGLELSVPPVQCVHWRPRLASWLKAFRMCRSLYAGRRSERLWVGGGSGCSPRHRCRRRSGRSGRCRRRTRRGGRRVCGRRWPLWCARSRSCPPLRRTECCRSGWKDTTDGATAVAITRVGCAVLQASGGWRKWVVEIPLAYPDPEEGGAAQGSAEMNEEDSDFRAIHLYVVR